MINQCVGLSTLNCDAKPVIRSSANGNLNGQLSWSMYLSRTWDVSVNLPTIPEVFEYNALKISKLWEIKWKQNF